MLGARPTPKRREEKPWQARPPTRHEGGQAKQDGACLAWMPWDSNEDEFDGGRQGSSCLVPMHSYALKPRDCDRPWEGRRDEAKCPAADALATREKNGHPRCRRRLQRLRHMFCCVASKSFDLTALFVQQDALLGLGGHSA